MKITTVCGDIAPEKLGLTSIHEHTLLSTAVVAELMQVPDTIPPEKLKVNLENLTYLKTTGSSFAKELLTYDDIEAEVKELEMFREVGGQSIMDCSYNGCRLDIKNTRILSERSGVNIVACTGYLGEMIYPKGFDPYDAEAIRRFELDEIRSGIQGTDIRAGCIKSGFGFMDAITGCDISEKELAVFRTSCSVAAETGYPIAIHPPMVKEHALRIVDIAINECGVKPEQIDVCHQCCFMFFNDVNPSYHDYLTDTNKVVQNYVDYMDRLLGKGVYVDIEFGMNTESHRFSLPYSWGFDDVTRMRCLVALLDKGYASQIMLGHDKCQRIQNYYCGGYGYTRFPEFVLPALREMGYEKEIRQLTVENPASFLAHE